VGLEFPDARRGVLRNLILGAVRSLCVTGRIGEALQVLDSGEARAVEPADRGAFEATRREILAQVGRR
jgi:hypothetical protein